MIPMAMLVTARLRRKPGQNNDCAAGRTAACPDIPGSTGEGTAAIASDDIFGVRSHGIGQGLRIGLSAQPSTINHAFRPISVKRAATVRNLKSLVPFGIERGEEGVGFPSNLDIPLGGSAVVAEALQRANFGQRAEHGFRVAARS